LAASSSVSAGAAVCHDRAEVIEPEGRIDQVLPQAGDDAF
jgi:hypothetical protein